ncbi:PAS domain-containing protein [Jannaschia sp. LMIT008]|uniref:PAS domain-containing protein n=1 Tax=Jannaschia maritima TaxID=3032585 RepID=UPI002810E78A|nr:PAS domain-containing protein [Jannaschia sp. LMIT008]
MTDIRTGTPQEGLELNPAAYDSSDNDRIRALGIDPATLYEQSLQQTRMAITLTDPFQDDTPIIYANRAFVELTGYDLGQVIGRNCRFLQGPDTASEAVDAIRDAIAAREVRVVEILNYRSDGTTFWNALHVGPVFDEGGALTHYYGSQWDITDVVHERERSALQVQVADELQHRTGNLFAVIGSILRATARNETDVATVVEKMEGRLRSLDRAHRISIAEGRDRGERSDLHELVSTILEPYRTANSKRIVLSGELVGIPREAVTPIGLILHELATNALKYGAFSLPAGSVSVEWTQEDDTIVLRWTERGGPAVVRPSRSGTGSRITTGVLRSIRADLRQDWAAEGMRATLRMPAS